MAWYTTDCGAREFFSTLLDTRSSSGTCGCWNFVLWFLACREEALADEAPNEVQLSLIVQLAGQAGPP